MSAYGMTLTVLATQLADATRKDEVEEDGFDTGAGMFGRHVSDWLHQVARQIDDMQERGPSIPSGVVYVPFEIIDRFPEIHPSNYDHDDVCALNAWGVELVLAAVPKPGEE